jgi:hypothetical protein
VKFPVTVEFYDQRAKVYAPASNFPFYRVAFKVAGKRRMLTFGSYGEAKKAAEDKVKELHKGQQSSALTAKQAQDALIVRDMLAAYRQETGKLVSIVEMTGNYLSAVKQLPKGCSLTEAVRVYRQSIAAVQRKPLADAIAEFCDARRPKGVSQDGKRSVLSPVYVQDTERQLNEFAAANTGADVCDLTKQHLDLFVEAHATLSPKSRNHYRATLRMFFGWCQRRDYLAANHRLLEADGLRKEDADTGDVDYYRPAELRLMLDKAAPETGVVEGQHRDGDADTAHEPPEQAAFETPGAAFGIGRGVGIGEAEFGFHARGRLGVGYWVKASTGQKVPTPTALLESRPKILKKAKMTAGAAAMIAPPMMDILPWSTSPRRMAKPP